MRSKAFFFLSLALALFTPTISWSTSISPENPYAFFLTLWEDGNPITPPVPMTFLQSDFEVAVDRTITFTPSSLLTEDSDPTGPVLAPQTFTLSPDIDITALHPYFVALRAACLEKSPEALHVRTRLRTLFEALNHKQLLWNLENLPLTPEDLSAQFLDWHQQLIDVTESIRLMPEQFLQTTDAHFFEWVLSQFRRHFRLHEGMRLDAAQTATILEKALDLGTRVFTTVETLFAHFTDEALDQWLDPLPEVDDVTGEDGLSLTMTPEDRLATARVEKRRLMLPIYHLLMESYTTVADLLAHMFAERVVTDDQRAVRYLHLPDLFIADDFQVQMLRFGVVESFASNAHVHFNPLVSETHKDIPEFTTLYQAFISKLLEDNATQLILALGHPQLWTKPNTVIDDGERGHRLTTKETFLHAKGLPLLDLIVHWYTILAEAYQSNLTALTPPEDLTPETQDQWNEKIAAFKRQLLDAHKIKQKWETTHISVMAAVKKYALERATFGLPPLEIPDAGTAE